MRQSLAFAWLNLSRGDRARAAVCVAGASVAIFIVLLHLAFLRAVEHKAAQVYSLFDADLVMVSDRFQFLYRTGDFPAARLRQALAQPGVEKVAVVRLATGRWIVPRTHAESSLFLMGLDIDPAFLADARLRELVPQLGASRRVLLDRRSDPPVGRMRVGETGRIGTQPATVVGLYELGLPMYAAATAIVTLMDFALYTGRDPRRMELGLLRIAPDADPAELARRLQQSLPDDIRVMTHEALMAEEARYFIDVKPLGITMRAGLVIGLVVGAVALFQVMAGQAESRVRDFAVLRAMGFSPAFGYAVGAWQLLLLGGAAFAISWLAAVPVFEAIARNTHLAMRPDAALASTTLLLCAPMIAMAALPLLEAGRADPVQLFAR